MLAQAVQWPEYTLLAIIRYAPVAHVCTQPAAPITSPRTGSGLLMTAVSATAGCSMRASSTSPGPIRYLERNHLSEEPAPPGPGRVWNRQNEDLGPTPRPEQLTRWS